jgi:hypothetical protein
MVHRVDESRETKDVGKEDKLLTDIGADLARRGEELDGGPAHVRAGQRKGRGRRRKRKKTHIHSSVVRLTSRAKSWRWVTSFSKTNFCLQAGEGAGSTGEGEKGESALAGRKEKKRWKTWKGTCSAHLGFWQRALMAWTFSVMTAGDWSVKSGRRDCFDGRRSASARTR